MNTAEEIKVLDDRVELFESLVPIKHPFGVWVNDYRQRYIDHNKIDVSDNEKMVRLSRFIRAKILGGVSLHKIALVDMGRIVFGTFRQHESFTSWLVNQQYNPNIQDNTQEIIDNELNNRKWLEDKMGMKFERNEHAEQSLCSSKT